MNYGAVKPEGAAMLARVHAEAFEDAPWTAQDIARLLETPSAYAIVAHENDAAQGFVLAWAPAEEAEILTIAVRPAARRKGVGVGLVNAAIAAALIRGAGAMFLEVAEDNDAARALYEKLGFEEIGRRDAYYKRDDGQVDALVLRRSLPRPQV